MCLSGVRRHQINRLGTELPMTNTHVATPGGFRPKSLVHLVEPGYVLRGGEGLVRKFNVATNTLIELPYAMLRPRDIRGLNTGWVADAYWNGESTRSHIQSFSATWIVPPAPSSSDGQLIYLFNGLQNQGTVFGILQPVLQWGTSAAGGGEFWSISSWYALSNQQAFHTPAVTVEPGRILTGVVTQTGQYPGLFNYRCEFQGIAGTSLEVEQIDELRIAYVALEAYQIAKCHNYPHTEKTTFSQMNLQLSAAPAVANWSKDDLITDCGQHVGFINNSLVDGVVEIFYGQQSRDEA
jgi:hypothetical protein